MSLVTLLPFIVLIGAMFLMTRSAKKKQQAAAQMRDEMQPGTGIRTIGGMYATVKEVHADMVLLEVAPGVHAVYAKNAIGAVLDDDEYNRIVHGDDASDSDTPVVPDDASSLTGPADTDSSDEARIDLGKKPEGTTDAELADATTEAKADEKAESKAENKAENKAEGTTDGESGAK
ncbi:preprotein translocase subunit YajC [Streptomyces sp. JV176]|uniref:preprotein translocase subunit YajC n=1 Tax=Streptomyces sp. JV176 TaxID=858630 RepID=UPI002E79E455|nr:preprotein translocase subunit YajC [Streptomyces sp. JV176]MEE1797483.1 preprotein translocase subunit YajC [Streptomyces sp. JV176]